MAGFRMPFEIRAEPFALGTKLFTFEQTRRDKALAHSFTPEPRMGSLTVPQNASYSDYARYAEYCLRMRISLRSVGCAAKCALKG